MKYSLILTSFCLLTLLVFPSPYAHSQGTFNANKKTAAHQNIPGTKVWLLPPANFQLSKNFKGFQNPENQQAMIMLTEIPGPYNEVIKGFTDGRTLPSGMVLQNKSSYKLNNLDLIFLEIEQSANNSIFNKYIVVFGNEKGTTMINGVFSKDSVNLAKQIKSSLLSLHYDDFQVIDVRGSLGYSIDESKTNLKFASVMGNAIILNKDGRLPSQSAEKVSFIVDKSFANIEIKDKKLFCLSRLKKLPYPDTKINIDKGITPVEIDGLNGYELYATALDENDKFKEHIYQVILFAKDGYYAFIGNYDAENAETINQLKTLARTFKRK